MRSGIRKLWLASPRTLYTQRAVQDKDHSQDLVLMRPEASAATGAVHLLHDLLSVLDAGRGPRDIHR